MDQDVKVMVNGQPVEHRGENNLASLVEMMGARADRVAVMMGDEIVPRGKWSQHPLAEGDRIEIMTFMGGG